MSSLLYPGYSNIPQGTVKRKFLRLLKSITILLHNTVAASLQYVPLHSEWVWLRCRERAQRHGWYQEQVSHSVPVCPASVHPGRCSLSVMSPTQGVADSCVASWRANTQGHNWYTSSTESNFDQKFHFVIDLQICHRLEAPVWILHSTCHNKWR